MSLFRRISEPRIYLPLLGLVAFLVAPLAIESPFYLHVLVMILFYAALSQAWNIIGGFGGQLSLGPGIDARADRVTLARREDTRPLVGHRHSTNRPTVRSA